ncbi:hypothetical protein J4453_03695, partial [Candidatus Woesearchaeota archaeon]|nr:hypothetical protein [Candidatus Woesearchaeota archaeon]
MPDEGLTEAAANEQGRRGEGTQRQLGRGTALAWIFLAFLLYLYDIGWLDDFLRIVLYPLKGLLWILGKSTSYDSWLTWNTGFSGFDVQQFFSVFSALGEWENLSRILFNIFVVIALSVYVASHLGKGLGWWATHWKEIVTTLLLIFTASLFLSLGVLKFSLPHAAFVLLFYFFIRNYYQDKVMVNIIFMVLLFIDYVGYGMLHYFAPEIELTRAIFPIWLYVTLVTSQQKVESPLITLLLAALLIFTLGNFAKDAYAIAVGPADVDVGQAQTEAKEQGKTVIQKFNEGLQAQLEYATGGYYKGRVEENVNEPLGVYFEKVRAASPRFYTDESVEVWGTIMAKTLDQDEPVNLTVSCKTKENVPGKVNAQKNASFKIYTAEEEAISCKFDSEALGRGTHEIQLMANFNFKTLSFLKSYFMDRERLRSLRREGIDPLTQYGITEKNPIALFTNGPVRIGMETNPPPIGISSNDEPSTPYLGITIENQWEGQVTRIKELIVQIPRSMQFISNCDERFEWIPPRTLEDNDYNTYVLNDVGRRAFKTPIGKDTDIDIEYRSVRCLMHIPNAPEALGETPVATHFFRTSVTYDYELKEKQNINVELPPGTEEEVSSGGFCKNYDLNKIGESALKPCQPYLTDFTTVHNEMHFKDKIDLLMLMSVAYQESRCNPTILNGGIMQKHGRNYTSTDPVQLQIKEGADV